MWAERGVLLHTTEVYAYCDKLHFLRFHGINDSDIEFYEVFRVYMRQLLGVRGVYRVLGPK